MMSQTVLSDLVRLEEAVASLSPCRWEGELLMVKRARWASFASRMEDIGRPIVSYGAAPRCNWTLVYIKEQTSYGARWLSDRPRRSMELFAAALSGVSAIVTGGVAPLPGFDSSTAPVTNSARALIERALSLSYAMGATG